jgi:hypothetical protein
MTRKHWIIASLSLGLSISAGCEPEKNSTTSLLPQLEPKPKTLSPLPASEPFKGKTLEQWAIAWRQWAYSQTSCDSPHSDIDGSLCGLYQDEESPVFFFDFSPSDEPRTKCRVPAGKAIFVPIVSVSNDNAGVPEPVSNAELRSVVDEILPTMRDLKLVADGIEVLDLERGQVGTVEFSYYVPPEKNSYSCSGYEGVADVTVSPSYLAGYFALLAPPEPGEHTLDTSGVFTIPGQDIELTVSTTFTVEKPRE